MSLLTPEKLPVKVYKWDDAGAPALDKTAGCVANIFKTCLVTGYGTKTSAGWTMPFGDTTAGIKVLRPEVSVEKDFYLRLSSDTGEVVNPQVYLNMTDVNTGDLKLQCSSPFSYALANSTGKWLLLATARSFWFFCEQRNEGDVNKTGSFIFCGDIAKSESGQRAVYLQHTAKGSYGNGIHSSIFGVYASNIEKSSAYYNYGKLLYGASDTVVQLDISSLANGWTDITNHDHVTLGYIVSNKELRIIPGLLVPLSGGKYNNFDVKNVVVGDEVVPSVVFGTSGRTNTNIYISTTEWVY